MADAGQIGAAAVATNSERLRDAGIDVSRLGWFLKMTQAAEIDRLPPDALYLPGQETKRGETTIDLATGRPLYLLQTVPPGSVYCLLAPLKRLMRTEAIRGS